MGDLTPFEIHLEYVCPTLRVCNCASCGDLLVSEESRRKHPHYARGIGVVYVRNRGKPFCKACFACGEVRRVVAEWKPETLTVGAS
jgi:hypothetical protein